MIGKLPDDALRKVLKELKFENHLNKKEKTEKIENILTI